MSDLFSDAACTRPLFSYALVFPAACDTGAHKPRWAIPSSTGCGLPPALTPLRPILDLHKGDVFSGAPGRCVRADAMVLAQFEIYDLGDPVDPKTVFPQVTRLNY